MPDIIATGEMLIDFVSTEAGVSLVDAPAFTKAAGGAPANVAVGAARLGLSSGFMGMVGDDVFGRFLQQTLEENKVDTSALRFSTEARTALAFVSLRADGERDFIFYRHPSADMLYSPEDVDPQYVASARIFHYGSISLGAERSMAATLHALDIARQHDLFISYDPNLRLNLWSSEQAARNGIQIGWPHANLVKVSEEELYFLTGIADHDQAARSLWHDRLKLMVVTLGSRGTLYFTPDASGKVPGYSVPVIDTTGAGDGFLAGLLYKLAPSLDALAASSLEQPVLHSALRFANAVGALTTTRRGAIPSLPTLSQVEALLPPPE
ncbi:MAG: PfkB family carbohydrate kinase [Chloroflexota bacterium]